MLDSGIHLLMIQLYLMEISCKIITDDLLHSLHWFSYHHDYLPSSQVHHTDSSFCDYFALLVDLFKFHCHHSVCSAEEHIE